MTGIYIHVPFCLRKCPYCAFYSVKYDSLLAQEYVSALVRNIGRYREENIAVDTVYFGGGTPSLLSPESVDSVLRGICGSFDVSDGAEITMEANPSSVSLESLRGYASAGVNRISLGVQSASDIELKALGRLHNFDDARKAVENTVLAGIKNISCDIMLGTPLQTLDSVVYSAGRIAELEVGHISCYMLKIEEGTLFDCDKIRSQAASDDLCADMYLALCEKLEGLGYQRYEISNFAKPGCESRHNLKYWLREDYIGFGPSAHSFFGGKRFYVPDDLGLFVGSQLQTEITEDSHPDALEEYIMLSLRLSDGISFESISRLGGNAEAVKKAAKPYISAGLASSDGQRVFLTDKGALVSNGIICELYLAAIKQNA